MTMGGCRPFVMTTGAMAIRDDGQIVIARSLLRRRGNPRVLWLLSFAFNYLLPAALLPVAADGFCRQGRLSVAQAVSGFACL